jgi:hypothetical protein
VEELERHAGVQFVTDVVYNTAEIPKTLLRRYVDEGVSVYCVDAAKSGKIRYNGKDLLSETLGHTAKSDRLRRTLVRHNPSKLS